MDRHGLGIDLPRPRRHGTELVQAQPSVSLSLIESFRPKPRRVIDVGGGQSPLAGELLARGVEDVTVLDISKSAIERGRERFGPRADQVRWIVGDVLEPQDVGEFDLWHDRAVFHFLIKPEDRRRYVAAASRRVCTGGHAIVATFALTGPEMCSGLPVRRCDAARLAREFGHGSGWLGRPTSRIQHLGGSAKRLHVCCPLPHVIAAGSPSVPKHGAFWVALPAGRPTIKMGRIPPLFP